MWRANSKAKTVDVNGFAEWYYSCTLKGVMDIYVHVAAGAAIGVLTKSTANLIFPDMEEKSSSVSGKLARALELGTMYGAGFTGGLLSHIFLDMLPHGDYLAYYGDLLIPDSLWLLREGVAALLVLLLVMVLLRGRSKLAALAAGIGGALLDLDNLAIGLGWIERSQALSPSHSGVWPHGQNIGVPSFVFEIGMLVLSLGIVFVYSRRQARRSVSPPRQSKSKVVVAQQLHGP
jgi:hypothetical protein